MRQINGRKAIIVISSGLDTFSKTTYQQILQAAQDSPAPIYTIGMLRLIKREADMYGAKAPFARIDWDGAEKRLEALAAASGGRAYVLDFDLEIPAVYDDIMENLRLRYVITYVSSNVETSGPPRRIRVELIDPRTSEALRIRDSSGKAITARVFVQETQARPKADREIAPDAVAAIKSELPYAHQLIKTIVKSGWVTLEGEVKWKLSKSVC
jgi:hypothetical protein